MVQFFKGSADPRDAAWGQLATALGQGLGKGLNTYYANKALQEVLEDESMVDAPISAKMGKLHSALSPYGEIGQQVFQNQFATEQQRMQEDQQDVLGRVVSGEKVSPKQLSKLTPENQLKVFELQKRENQDEV